MNLILTVSQGSFVVSAKLKHFEAVGLWKTYPYGPLHQHVTGVAWDVRESTPRYPLAGLSLYKA